MIIFVLAGVLLSFAYSFGVLGWLAWFALIPFFGLIFSMKGAKPRFFASFLFGFAFYLSSLAWFLLIKPMDEVSGFSMYFLLAAGWLLLGGVLALCLGFWGALSHFFAKSIWQQVLYWPCAWFLLESSFSYLFGGFPWVILGNSLAGYPIFIQSASIWGATGLSSFLVLLQCLLAAFWLQRKMIYVGLACILFIGNLGFGYFSLGEQEDTEEYWQVATLQTSYSTAQKWSSEDEAMWQQYQGLCEEIVNQSTEEVDLILWPETSFPYQILDSKEWSQKFISLAEGLNTNLLVGGYYGQDEDTYNTLFEVSKTGTLQPVYLKQFLVPFGEYLPAENILKQIVSEEWLEQFPMGHLSSGKPQGAADFMDVKFAGMICYDSIFSDLLQKPIQEGAKIILVSSNESWYVGSTALWQHFAHSIMRGVEYQRYVVRSANGGYSAIIDAHGQVLQEGTLGAFETLSAQVPLLSLIHI